ncbi:hypothetical protein [Streptomyces asiaticus]|uniref:hypothetical protein n=1 Tax=Streptomyces asiaticus TaxID=114695 RepID=UPI003D75939A
MTTIAVTGHMDLTDASVPLVRGELDKLLAAYDTAGLVGVSCVKPDHAATFDRLVEAADEVLVMPYETADRQAYEAANAVLLERADRLVAVWDGRPPSGKGGGTADMVGQARGAGVPVDVVWPDGVSRWA